MSDFELMKQLNLTCALARRKPKRADGGGKHKRRAFGHLLDTLMTHDGMSQQEIADALGIRPQSVSEAVSILDERGLIRREKCPNDGRKTLIYITPAGVARREDAANSGRAHAEAFFSALTEQEKQTLGALLEKLTAAQEKTEDQEDGENQEDQEEGARKERTNG